MLGVEEIEDWVGQDVFDSGGERVGKLQEVFYLTRTGEATFATIVDDLAKTYAAPRERILADVTALLRGLADKKLLEL